MDTASDNYYTAVIRHNDNTVNITWDTDKISSGSFERSKSANNINGDQIYTCRIQNITNRIHTLKVKGITLFLTVHIIMI